MGNTTHQLHELTLNIREIKASCELVNVVATIDVFKFPFEKDFNSKPAFIYFFTFAALFEFLISLFLISNFTHGY